MRAFVLVVCLVSALASASAQRPAGRPFVPSFPLVPGSFRPVATPRFPAPDAIAVPNAAVPAASSSSSFPDTFRSALPAPQQNQAFNVNPQFLLSQQNPPLTTQFQSFHTPRPQFQSFQTPRPQFQSFQTPRPQFQTFQTPRPQFQSFQTPRPQFQTFQTPRSQFQPQSFGQQDSFAQQQSFARPRPQQQLREESFLAQQQREQDQDGVRPRRVQLRQSGLRDAAQTKPDVAIIHSAYNLPNGDNSAFEYSFEAENGIKQEAAGELRTVDDSDVIVMKGQYEYVGDDGETYTVNWYADETGFHAQAPHLPQPVPIPFPEQAAAVEAQIRFAEEHPESEDSDGSADGNRFRGQGNDRRNNDINEDSTRFRRGQNKFGGAFSRRTNSQLETPQQFLTLPGVQSPGTSFATPFRNNNNDNADVRRRRPI